MALGEKWPFGKVKLAFGSLLGMKVISGWLNCSLFRMNDSVGWNWAMWQLELALRESDQVLSLKQIYRANAISVAEDLNQFWLTRLGVALWLMVDMG